MFKKITITDDFIDNFNSIYNSELNKMKDKLIKNDIPVHDDDEYTLILINYFLDDETESKITEWKKTECYQDYLQKKDEFDLGDFLDADYTDECYLAGKILLYHDVTSEKVKSFIKKLNFNKKFYLSYKLKNIREDDTVWSKLPDPLSVNANFMYA